MAWNEPGKGQDPWGQGGNNNPPDLDEVIKKLQKKFGGLFGGGDSGDGTTKGLGLGALVVLATIVWAAFGIYIVDPAERAVILRFGKYHSTAEPGPHWRMPLVDTKVLVNVDELRSHPLEQLMLTQDENIVAVDLTIQYKIKDVKNYVINVLHPDNTLKLATESALRQVVGKSKLDYVLTDGREVVADNILELLQTLLDRYGAGLVVTAVNMQKAEPPEQVRDAFDDVIKAREDKVRLRNEAEAYANQIVPVARGNAQRLLAEANAYRESVIAHADGEAKRFDQLLVEYEKAPKVTRERLYLEAIESVLTNTTKVMIDVEGGNNLVYLPLDKLIGGTANTDRKAEVKTNELGTGIVDKVRDSLSSAQANEILSSRDRSRSRERGM